MIKKSSIKGKNGLCRMCKYDCKDLYKYGEKYVHPECQWMKKVNKM